MSDLGFVMVAILAFISVAGVGWVFVGDSGGSAQKKRMKAVTTGVAASAKARTKKRAADLAQNRRRQVQESLKQIEQGQKQERKKSLTLEAQLRQAGVNITPMVFWLISAGIGLVLFTLVSLRGQPLWMGAAIGFIAGFGLPRWWLGMARKRRAKKFTEEFVNAIDIIVRGVKTGLPLNDCLKMIVREVGEPVSSEFRKLSEEQTAGVPMDESLNRIYQRMPLPEVNFFATVLVIQQKTGGNLSESLGNLSAVLRARKMMREKIAALSSEAKASAMIIGSLPPVVMGLVYMTTPSYMMTLFTAPTGRLLLAGSAIWMGLGIFVMRKMINFKF